MHTKGTTTLLRTSFRNDEKKWTKQLLVVLSAISIFVAGFRMSDPYVPRSSRSKKGRHVFCLNFRPHPSSPPVTSFMNGPKQENHFFWLQEKICVIFLVFVRGNLSHKHIQRINVQVRIKITQNCKLYQSIPCVPKNQKIFCALDFKLFEKP